jgi:hypothetical protein
MEYETMKEFGANKFKHHKQSQLTGIRSLNWWGSNDKHRGLRRVADRHSHHRRRNHLRNKIASGSLNGIEDCPPPSSTKKKGCADGWSWKISNRKLM